MSGNLKFDVPAPALPPIVASLRTAFHQAGAGPVIVCGSTVDDEERLLLRAFENVLASHPRAVMILAPRHPERFGEVAQLLEQLGLRFWRRSLWAGNRITGGVLLIDYDRGTSGALLAGRHRVCRREPRPARRTQHHRAGTARRSHCRRKPHGEFSRYRGTVSSSRCSARGQFGGPSSGFHGADFQRGGACCAGPPRCRDSAFSDGRDAANLSGHWRSCCTRRWTAQPLGAAEDCQVGTSRHEIRRSPL